MFTFGQRAVRHVPKMSLNDRVMRLDHFSNHSFDRGASRLTEIAWTIVQGLFFSSWMPGSRWRCALLRLFGARLGRGVVIKPFVVVKFPWRLSVGDHVWIGERAWIDSLAEVTIGAHSCISQGAYLCTGSHDWNDPAFALITRPIVIGTGCWVGAFARVAPGSVMEDQSVLGMHAFCNGRLSSGFVYRADGTKRVRMKNNKED
jgi:putative colanic acid biosynthesis acetyltransferase WcaF